MKGKSKKIGAAEKKLTKDTSLNKKNIIYPTTSSDQDSSLNDTTDPNVRKDYLANRFAQHKPKKEEKTVSQVLQGREKFYDSISESVLALSRRAGEQNKTAELLPVTNPDQIWANTIVSLMGRMDGDSKDFFMAHVFDIGMKAARGMWPD